MDICLLCDEPMYEKPVDGSAADPVKKYRHREHIIQNAIGGRLKSADILCESCGGILNDEIDADFQKLFLLITARLSNMAKDRNAGANTRLQGTHVTTNKRVKFSGKKPVPLKPSVEIDDAKQEATIYCPKNLIVNFRKSVIKKLTAENKQHFKIVEVNEFPQDDHVWLSFSKDVENFNDKWKMGFIKIATEFAYMKGVQKDQLVKTLDKENKKLVFSDNLYPYVPVTAIDHFLEYNKNIIQRNYPTHTLHLFSQSINDHDRQLLCYVELFSTFQYYVLLTDNYTGPEIMESYSQKLVTEEKHNLDIRQLEPKELMAEADRLGINLRNSTGFSMEDAYAYFEREYAKLQQVYTLDLRTELSIALETLTTSIMHSMLPVSMSLSGAMYTEVIEFLRESSTEYKMQLCNEIRDFYTKNKDILLDRFRKMYPENNIAGGVDFISMVEKCLQISALDMQRVQEYGHEKFSFLSYFLNVQQNLKK